MKKILIMGLSGSGKTTLAKQLVEILPNCLWLNADNIRKQFNDWDFSVEGRLRQASRIKSICDISNVGFQYIVMDFIAPFPESRSIVGADFTIWMDTVSASKFIDTDALFVPPQSYDLRITNFNYCVDDLLRDLT